MKGICFGLLIVIGCLGVWGCKGKRSPNSLQTELATMVARHSDKPVVIDGKLDDPVWKEALVYKLALPRDRERAGQALAEVGEVQLAWDNGYFYVAVKYYDSDIVAEGQKDQLHHYNLGDLVELFLKPTDAGYYWELYATPAGKKTSFWYPGRGRLGLPSGFSYSCGLNVAAQVNGTLNNWRDRDACWTAEMAMPIKDLTSEGSRFGLGSEWRILVARYNYSRYLDIKGPEYSVTPQLSAVNFHLVSEYARLLFE